jgi:hypothetical protein
MSTQQVTGVNPFLREKRGSRIVVSDKEARTEDGIVFSSKWEMRVYKYLRDAFGADAFELQPSFELQPKFAGCDGKTVRGIFYKADFIFGPKRESNSSPIHEGHTVIDAKGMKDAVFKMKAKMFEFKYRQPLHLPSRVGQLKNLEKTIRAKL